MKILNICNRFQLHNVLNFYPFKANYMFLRATNSWISHGPKEMEDLAFDFHKATSGTSFRSPR